MARAISNNGFERAGSSAGDRSLIDAAWAQAALLNGDSAPRAWEGQAISGSVPSDSFPGYEIVREVFRGGQGIVYQAVQKGIERQVAIKVLREGPFAGPKDRARFEREVHILGQLKHPNIVAIHDSGEAAGRAYFVMDYIGGQSLDVYVASRQRSVEDTLRLFEKVCEAVHAAHLRGIIHRDLKPSNIRVDERGEPHILDFGLSKMATAEAIGARPPSVMTQTGQFVGSLPWASPEQAGGGGELVDIRTDVYSLGVILYQILTGRFPYDIAGNLRDVLDNILQATPLRPRAIRRQIDLEVETIVLKCLAKEPEQRYQSAGGLAGDIRRYLADEPILARPPTLAYQLRKLARRRRAAVTAAAVACLSLAIGVGAAVRQTIVATRARNDAEAAASLAARRQTEAERAARTGRHVREFLEGMLAFPNPDMTLGRDTRLLRELLDAAAERVERELADEPAVAADVRYAIGNTYASLGFYDQAVAHLGSVVDSRRAHPTEGSADVSVALRKLAYSCYMRGDYAEAETRIREALELRRPASGEDDTDFADCLNDLGEVLFAASRTQSDRSREAEMLREAREALERALAIRRRLLGEDHLETARSWMNLANVATARKDLMTAEQCYEQARTILGRQPMPPLRAEATVQYQLATLKRAKGEAAEAEALFREALESYRALLGPDHPSVAVASLSLAGMIQARGDPAGAEPLFRDAVAIRRKGSDQGILADAVHGLARCLEDQQKVDEALPLLREAVALYREVFGDSHVFTGRAIGNLARFQAARGEYEEAERLLHECLEILRGALGDGHPDIGTTRERLARLYEAWGKPDQAAQWRSEAPTSQAAE